MQYTLKSFLAGFCPEMGEESTNLRLFFFNEKLLMNLSKSVLTDGRCQNLPKSRSLL